MNAQECGKVVFERLVKGMETIRAKSITPEQKDAQIAGIILKQFGAGFTINEILDADAKNEYWKLEIQSRRAQHTAITEASARRTRLVAAYLGGLDTDSAE